MSGLRLSGKSGTLGAAVAVVVEVMVVLDVVAEVGGLPTTEKTWMGPFGHFGDAVERVYLEDTPPARGQL